MPSTEETSRRSRTRRQQPAPIDNTYGHLPPQALDVEQVVLGALLIDAEAFGVVSELLHPDTFYDPRHKQIFTAIQTLNMR